jgi:hypothetical protein
MAASIPNKPLADYLGIGSALVCLVHCLAGPLFMGLSAHAHEQGELHHLLDPSWNYLFLGLGGIAVRHSARRAAQPLVRYSLWISLALLALSLLLEERLPGIHYAVYLTSGALIVFHVINLRSHFHRPKSAACGCGGEKGVGIC